ncbi:YcjF family protein [Dubosiella newyorkensis]|uniref:YcjF family protein n=1 Tax=Dubosiella newyorkensis TaxID=1862672 RepID=UPI00272D93AF|nr:GTPase [Dubosiella newyorkensis]
MEIKTETIVKQCLETIQEKINDLNTLNILVIGKSGVGKSTLINTMFRGELAKTGLGRPITQEIRKIEKKDVPLVIYDTPGFELSSSQQKQVKEEIIELLEQGARSKDINDAIHCIWYCINVGANRTFDETELQWLRTLTSENQKFKVPIFIVLTQAIPKKKAQEMKQLIEKENLDIVKVVPVLAKDMEFDDEYTAKAYGLDHLVDLMSEALPQELEKAFQNVQIANLDAKKKSARKAIATAVSASFTEGFSPIPFADAALLVPTQVSMIAAITIIYGFEANKRFLTAFMSATIGPLLATGLGRTLSANLLKLIPGAGSLGGGLISATTASLITTAMGEAYIRLMEMIIKGEIRKEDLETRAGKKQITQLFKKNLK